MQRILLDSAHDTVHHEAEHKTPMDIHRTSTRSQTGKEKQRESSESNSTADRGA